MKARSLKTLAALLAVTAFALLAAPARGEDADEGWEKHLDKARDVAQSDDPAEAPLTPAPPAVPAPRALAAPSGPIVAQPEGAGFVALLTIDGSINPGSADFLIHGIAEAQEEGARAVLIQLDTPGGALNSTHDIVKAILNAPLPVLVYVAPSGARAGSAGVFITLAGHIAAMAPGSNIGAAHPITGSGKDPEKEGGKHLAQKIENDTIAWVEGIALQRRRNVEWAKDAVRNSVSITAERAEELHVVDFLASSTTEVLTKADHRVVEVLGKRISLRTKGLELRPIRMSIKQRFVGFFADPSLLGILFMLGVLGIVGEIYHPGALFPGLIGAICLILAFIGIQALPIHYGALLLLLLAGVLFGVEIFVGAFGVIGIGGVVSMVLGLLLLVDSTDPALRISLTSILPVAMLLSGFFVFASYNIIKTHRAKVLGGKEAMIGAVATVLEESIPGGDAQVMIEGERWRGNAEVALCKGDKVRVERIEGLLLHLRKIDA